MKRSHPGKSPEDIAEMLEQASVLTTRHITDQAPLSVTAALTLSRLNKEGPIRLTTLAAAEGLAQPSMTQLIQRLERQGLVTRINDPEDGRAALVNITNAGRALMDDRRRDRRDRLADLLKGLSPEDEAALTLAAHVALPIIRRLVHNATNPARSQTGKTA
jgi:DNA-binding MarR family transcriptional regulator